MDLNFIVFPAPKCSYSEDVLNGKLIWIPKELDKENIFSRSNFLNNSTVNHNVK